MKGTWRWIPVTERLPEDGSDEVWVIIQEAGGSRYQTTAIKLTKEMANNYRGSPWYIYDCGLKFYEHLDVAARVTHWMPINLPPFPPPIDNFEGYGHRRVIKPDDESAVIY